MQKWAGVFSTMYAIYFVVSIGTGAFLFKNLVIAGEKCAREMDLRFLTLLVICIFIGQGPMVVSRRL